MTVFARLNEQQQSTVEALHFAGPEGVDRRQVENYPTLHGGPLILRLAARIGELEEMGYGIVHCSERRNGCMVYRLVHDPDAPVAEPVVVDRDPALPVYVNGRPLGMTPSGFLRRPMCELCRAVLKQPEDACGPVGTCLTDPGNYFDGRCLARRKTSTEEARIAA